MDSARVKYCDPISAKLGYWVQCQGKAKALYHGSCVGVKDNRTFICGRCANV